MKKILIAILAIFTFMLTSCKKEWLDEKSDKSLVIPSNLEDLQRLLDNSNIMNNRTQGISEVGTDNYYKSYNEWQFSYHVDRNSYVWASDIFEGDACSDWNYEYERVYYANAVLESLQRIEPGPDNSEDGKAIKGAALFFRALSFYNLAQLFCKPYNPSSATIDPGIPVRLKADINQVTERGNVAAVYQQIISDLDKAKQLLPEQVSIKTRPSKTAAEGLLADVYLTMRDYENAFVNVDAALSRYSTLIDYNTLNVASYDPFSKFNDEVIFHGGMISYGIIFSYFTNVDTALYSSYHNDDLRKVLFFTGSFSSTPGQFFKGSYFGVNYNYFSGLATDELILIRAECNARKNNTSAAMNDLNTLLRTRWRTGTYMDMTAATSQEALNRVLTERRKELLFRGRRWNDLRRLNMEPAHAITLTRMLNGQTYTLPPNDLKYVYPIPADEIRLGGIAQNPR